MIKFFCIILIIFSSCSLERKSFLKDKLITENKEIDSKKIDNKDIIKEDFNKDLKINLSKIMLAQLRSGLKIFQKQVNLKN